VCEREGAAAASSMAPIQNCLIIIVSSMKKELVIKFDAGSLDHGLVMTSSFVIHT